MKSAHIKIPTMYRPTRVIPRTRVRMHYYTSEDKPVFQYHRNGPPITFHEMEEAHSIFSEFPLEHRNDCYAMYNINGDAMKKYYRDALAFEKMYQRVVEHERKQKAWHFKLGPFHIYVSKD